ncbi:enoyl-CoA hydratase/isomerase family protein [Bacillus sp. M6-12]|uniref:enoyl-CoA hydratase/isomerase family protein n=1 Tax=Bacillus sp. M6-12 TaxID=2054166 RepID=UPI000C7774CC|nr:enoyl-CoA hydratase-related protein [Bacillus sp. M6-12]PLS18667.1 enoyl-CoA hydratase/isomerase family protein [Bacillus sp. M6-12]
MSYETILYEVNDGIAKIILNQPELRNPLSKQVTQELVNAITAADKDSDVKAIILSGNGKAFSAGGNLNEFKANFTKSVPDLHFEGRESTELFKLGATIKTPLIASVNGPALGGGCGIVAMCHIAIASEEAKLGLTELRLGIVPYVILPWIRRAAGDRKAMELMLTAEVFSAEKALEYNLVHRVVPHELLEEETLKIAKTIASYSPLAVQLGLDAFYATEQMDLMKSFDYLSTLRIISFRSEDLKEGAQAFLEKREPVWQGK